MARCDFRTPGGPNRSTASPCATQRAAARSWIWRLSTLGCALESKSASSRTFGKWAIFIAISSRRSFLRDTSRPTRNATASCSVSCLSPVSSSRLSSWSWIEVNCWRVRCSMSTSWSTAMLRSSRQRRQRARRAVAAATARPHPRPRPEAGPCVDPLQVRPVRDPPVPLVMLREGVPVMVQAHHQRLGVVYQHLVGDAAEVPERSLKAHEPRRLALALASP